MGTTSATCGFHDLDGDDAWGDCDEAPADPCCYCKIAVGCADSKCAFGNKVEGGNCSPCTANDCAHPTCMGLNGCPTNCQAGFYFDGVRCRDCSMSDQVDNIPACKLDGGMWTSRRSSREEALGAGSRRPLAARSSCVGRLGGWRQCASVRRLR